MNKRIILSILLISAIPWLSGCGSRQLDGITVMWWGDVYNYNFARKLVAAYKAENPDKQVKLIGGGGTQKLLSMAASRTLPDVVLVTTPEAYNMGSRGALLPLNKYTETAAFKAMEKEMWPGLMKSLNIKGQQWSVPIWTWTPGVYYNKDIFDKAGVPYPSRNWTFKEFEEKSRKLVKMENGRVKVYAFNASYSLANTLLVSYLYAHGGALYSEDTKRCLINTPASVAALKAFSDLRLKDRTSPRASDEAGMGTAGRNTDFFQAGSLAMTMGGRDYLDVLRQRGSVKFRWGAAPMPVGDKACFFQVASSLAISANTRHPGEAWRFVSFIAGEKGQKLITTDRSDVTIYKKLTYEKAFLNYQGRPDVNPVFRDMLLQTRPVPYRIDDDEWKAKAANHLSLVELGKISIEEACARIAADYVP